MDIASAMIHDASRSGCEHHLGRQPSTRPWRTRCRITVIATGFEKDPEGSSRSPYHKFKSEPSQKVTGAAAENNASAENAGTASAEGTAAGEDDEDDEDFFQILNIFNTKR